MMVHLTPRCLVVPRKFIDSLRIHVSGGRGGNGLPKYGGVGGKGGDVYAVGSKACSLKALRQQFPSQHFSAGAGEDSRKIQILGMPGTDFVVKCPLGISVVSDTHRLIGEVNEPGDRVLLASGGCGGGPQNNYIGQKGQTLSLTLDLKLIADVGFVGFPNAGKSTLLKALSNAKPKIANYPFTTLHPNIGMLQYEDLRKISAADLPGLIEGAHKNFGLGHRFLKHCLRTKILLFVVDINGFRLSPNHPHRTALETILYLNKELEMYEEDLISKPAILAVNKTDQDPQYKKFNQLKEDLKILKDRIEELPKELRPNHLVHFDSILSISAFKGTNVNHLKRKIRSIIDIYHEKNLLAKINTSSEDDESKDSEYVYI